MDKAYYRIADKETGEIIVPFDKTRNSTRLSQDADGMYFSFFTSGLPKKRLYGVDLLISDGGVEKLVHLTDVSFMVV